MRRALRALLPPPPADFRLQRPGGTSVVLRYREVIGLAALVEGGFEDEECTTLCAGATPGTVAIDVGANIGVLTIPLADAVGEEGLVIAVEPLAENVDRLMKNVADAGVRNVKVVAAAAGAHGGVLTMRLARDPAYGSVADANEFTTDASRTVSAVTVDDLWEHVDSRAVSVMKIDVEGAEPQVLAGATRLLRMCRPLVMVEASSPQALAQLSSILAPLGYERAQPAGFKPWNHLFVATAASPPQDEITDRS